MCDLGEIKWSVSVEVTGDGGFVYCGRFSGLERMQRLACCLRWRMSSAVVEFERCGD